MSKLSSIALTAWIATLLSVGYQMRRPNNNAAPRRQKNPHGQWWSYRLIDGRNCWYEGKPMLSKRCWNGPRRHPRNPEKLQALFTQKPGNPLDAQARTLNDSDTFEARWRERVDMR